LPILRIYDEAKAREFYVGFLGCEIDWQARFDDNAPIFMQVSRGAMVLRLSEHVGDGTPGTVVTVRMTGLDALHAELNGKRYKYMRPGIEDRPWGAREMVVVDPFGNRISFSEEKPKA
jgi:uncharacterized glyoxalase superfamily protein PhnB